MNFPTNQALTKCHLLLSPFNAYALIVTLCVRPVKEELVMVGFRTVGRRVTMLGGEKDELQMNIPDPCGSNSLIVSKYA